MKRFVTTLFFAIMLMEPLVSNAQELKFKIVEDVEPNPLDMTAREENRSDGDGHAYAIIKVTSDIENDDLSKFNFSFAFIKSIKEMHDGELWIYVARGAKSMDIRREGYKPIIKHQIKAIKEGTTYTMKLSVQTPKVIHRVLQFKVDPANEGAIVKVRPEESSADYELWGTVDANGSINRLLETGVYLYEVTADNYTSSQGRVVLTASSDGENFVENVKLTPNFGFLEIDGANGIAGAEVYINDKKVGTVPYRSDRMGCRDDYRLMISNGELYKTYSATFAINQGETTKLSPKLESNFAETTIKVDGDAEIFINGVSRGHGTWVGPLRAGSYDVECRLPSHESSTKQITVKPNLSETFLIEKPTPIEGSLYVNTSPSGAKIYIDDQDVGFTTPRNINHILVGHHKVSLMLANHKSETHEVDIRQDETTQLNVNLSDMAEMTIESTPSDANLYINDQYVGKTPYTEEIASGDYNIRLEKKHFHTLTKTVHFDSSNPMQKFSLRHQYQLKNQFYLQPMYQIGSYASYGAAIGFFVGNINIEADYLNGTDSETIHWNFTDGSYPWEDKLSSMYVGGKVGYGIVVGSRIRITPQIGYGILKVSGDESDSNTAKGIFGVRFDMAIVNHFSLVAAPEYSFSLAESDAYKKIIDVSSKVKGWGSGFNLYLGLSIYF